MAHKPTSSEKRRAASKVAAFALLVMAGFGLIAASTVWKESSVLSALRAEGRPTTAEVLSKSKERAARTVVYVVEYRFLAAKPPYPGLSEFGKGPWRHTVREQVSRAYFERLQAGQAVETRYTS